MREKGPDPFVFLLFAALGCGGLRPPWAWSCFAVLSWAAALAAPPRPPLPGLRLWAAALSWAGLSAALSPEPLLSAAGFAYAATTWLWLDIGATRTDEDSRRTGLALLWGAGALAALAAVAVEVPGYRAAGLLYPYYNYTAALVAAAGAAAAAAGAPGALGTAAAGAYLVWAGSRGGLLALGLGAAFALWRSGTRAPVLAAALIGASFLLVPSQTRDSLLKIDRPGSHQRPAIWRAAFDVARESPWFGEGPGRFSRGSLRHQTAAPASMGPARYRLRADRPHSEVLGAAAETGFVGAALVLAALFALWGRRPAGAPALARDGLSAAALALGVQATFDSIFALPALGWLCAWALGASCAPDGASPREGSPAARLALAGGLALAALAWWPGWAVTTWSASDPEAALLVAPSDDGLWQEAARARLRGGDPRGALEALGRAAGLAPYSAPVRVMAGEVLRSGGAWRQLRAVAEEALSLEPACGQAALQKAEAELRMGLPEDARRTLDSLAASQARPLSELAQSQDRLIIGYEAERLERLRAELR